MKFEKRAPADNMQVVAFGDDYNDFEMIIEFDLGIVMFIATDEVEAIVEYLCDTRIIKWFLKESS